MMNDDNDDVEDNWASVSLPYLSYRKFIPYDDDDDHWSILLLLLVVAALHLPPSDASADPPLLRAHPTNDRT